MSITFDVLAARLGLEHEEWDKGLEAANDKLGKFAEKAKDGFEKVKHGLEGLKESATVLSGVLAGVFTEAIHLGEKAEQVTFRLGVALKNSGTHARVTSGFIAEMSERLTENNKYTESNVQSIATLLLKFQSIRGERMFERLTKDAMDFASATGRDAVSAAEMLGRAMDNPIAGMRSLRMQAGLSVREMERIKGMAEAGNTTGAQMAILSAMEKRFRGAAEKETETFSGQWKRALKELENSFENLGLAIIPHLTPLVKGFADAAQHVSEFIKANKELISSTTGEWLEKIKNLVGGVVKAFQNLAHGTGSVGDMLKAGGAIAGIGAAFGWVTAVAKHIPLIGEFIAKIFELTNPMRILGNIVKVAVGGFQMLGAAVAFMMSPLGLVTMAVAAIAAGIYFLYTRTDLLGKAWVWMKGVALDAWGAIGKAIEWVEKQGNAFWKEHGEQIMRIAGKVWDLLVKAWDGLKKAFNEVWKVGKAMFADLLVAIEPLTTEMVELSKAFGEFVAIFYSTAWDGAKVGFKEILKTVEDIVDALGGKTDGIQSRWLSMVGAIKYAIGGLLEGIPGMKNAGATLKDDGLNDFKLAAISRTKVNEERAKQSADAHALDAPPGATGALPGNTIDDEWRRKMHLLPRPAAEAVQRGRFGAGGEAPLPTREDVQAGVMGEVGHVAGWIRGGTKSGMHDMSFMEGRDIDPMKASRGDLQGAARFRDMQMDRERSGLRGNASKEVQGEAERLADIVNNLNKSVVQAGSRAAREAALKAAEDAYQTYRKFMKRVADATEEGADAITKEIRKKNEERAKGAFGDFEKRGEGVVGGSLADVKEERQRLRRENREAMRENRGNRAQREQLTELSGDVESSEDAVQAASKGLQRAQKMRGPGRKEAIAEAQQLLEGAVNTARVAQENFQAAVKNIKDGNDDIIEVEKQAADDQIAEKKKNLTKEEEAMLKYKEHLAKMEAARVAELNKTLEGREILREEKNQAEADKHYKEFNDTIDQSSGFMAQFNQGLQGMVNSLSAASQAIGMSFGIEQQVQASGDKPAIAKMNLAKAQAQMQQLMNNVQFGGIGPQQAKDMMRLQTIITMLKQNPNADVSKIPQMAEGGVVRRPTLAMIGEDGPEAVVPLNRLHAFAGASGGAGNTVHINATFTQKYTQQDAAMLLDAMEREVKRRGVDMTGRSPLRSTARRTAINSRIH